MIAEDFLNSTLFQLGFDDALVEFDLENYELHGGAGLYASSASETVSEHSYGSNIRDNSDRQSNSSKSVSRYYPKKRKRVPLGSKIPVRNSDGSTNHIPRVLKRDIRRSMPQLMAHVFNSFDLNYVYKMMDVHASPEFSYSKSGGEVTNYGLNAFHGSSIIGFIFTIYLKYLSTPDIVITPGESVITINPDNSSVVETNLHCRGTVLYFLPIERVKTSFIDEMSNLTMTEKTNHESKRSKTEGEEDTIREAYFRENGSILEALGISDVSRLPVAPVEAKKISPKKIYYHAKQIVEFDQAMKIKKIVVEVDMSAI